jgi:hypothetical protein
MVGPRSDSNAKRGWPSHPIPSHPFSSYPAGNTSQQCLDKGKAQPMPLNARSAAAGDNG